jgi:hypothetical protein
MAEAIAIHFAAARGTADNVIIEPPERVVKTNDATS